MKHTSRFPVLFCIVLFFVLAFFTRDHARAAMYCLQDTKCISSFTAQLPIELIHDGRSDFGVVLRLVQNQVGNHDGPKLEFKKLISTSSLGGDYFTSWTAGILNGAGIETFGINLLGDAFKGFGKTAISIIYNSSNVGINTRSPNSGADLDVNGGLGVTNTSTNTTAVFRFFKGHKPLCGAFGSVLSRHWPVNTCNELGSAGTGDIHSGCSTSEGWSDTTPSCSITVTEHGGGIGGLSSKHSSHECVAEDWDAVLCIGDAQPNIFQYDAVVCNERQQVGYSGEHIPGCYGESWERDDLEAQAEYYQSVGQPFDPERFLNRPLHPKFFWSKPGEGGEEEIPPTVYDPTMGDYIPSVPEVTPPQKPASDAAGDPDKKGPLIVGDGKAWNTRYGVVSNLYQTAKAIKNQPLDLYNPGAAIDDHAINTVLDSVIPHTDAGQYSSYEDLGSHMTQEQADSIIRAVEEP